MTTCPDGNRTCCCRIEHLSVVIGLASTGKKKESRWFNELRLEIDQVLGCKWSEELRMLEKE